MPTQNLLRLLLLLTDTSDEDRVDISLLQIWKLSLVIKLNFCSDFEHKGWSRFLKLKFRQDFEAGVWRVFSADVLLGL